MGVEIPPKFVFWLKKLAENSFFHFFFSKTAIIPIALIRLSWYSHTVYLYSFTTFAENFRPLPIFLLVLHKCYKNPLFRPFWPIFDMFPKLVFSETHLFLISDIENGSVQNFMTIGETKFRNILPAPWEMKTNSTGIMSVTIYTHVTHIVDVWSTFQSTFR